MLSPVSADSLMPLVPEITTPSTGIPPPGFTRNTSPTITSSAGITISVPFRRTVASLGASLRRLLKASVVFPLARASSIFPTVMSVRIIAADSKYHSSLSEVNSKTTLYAHAVNEPIATSVSIFGLRCTAPRKPFTKNARFTAITKSDSASSAIPRALPSKKAGIGSPSMS